jgi:hypothetical protein
VDWLNWSDFAAALLGAAVGGVLAIVASLWSTTLLRRFEVAEQFASKVGAVTGGIDYALRVLDGRVQDPEGPEKAVGNAAHYLGELKPFLAVVQLRNRRARDDASQTYVHLEQAVAALEKGDSVAAKASLEAADGAFEDYVAQARRVR